MALSCAIFGSLCNILINKCDQIKSTLLVFYAGVSGIIISILGCLANSHENFYHLGELKATDWLILTFLSLSGILGKVSLKDLKSNFILSPTQVKCPLLISSIFDAMNFQHFLEMLEFDL